MVKKQTTKPIAKGKKKQVQAANKRRGLMAAMAVLVIGIASPLLWVSAATATYSLWPKDTKPKVADYADPKPVTVGVKFKSKYAGKVTSVRFYKGTRNTGTHTGQLWNDRGQLLASATFKNESATGWQTADLAKPVDIAANTTYVVSYHAPKGYYAVDTGYFRKAYKQGRLQAPANAGVYAYGDKMAYPSSTYNSSNYWVDVVMTNKRFTPAEKPQAPTNLQGVSLSGSVNLTWKASTTASIASYVVVRDGQAIATLNSQTTGYKDTSVLAEQTYSYQVKAVDNNGLSSDLTKVVEVKVIAPSNPNPDPNPPTPPAPAPTTGFPNGSNTGYRNAPGYPGQLTKFTGSVQSGQTYKYMEFPDGVYIDSDIKDVTFIGCRFTSNNVLDANVRVLGDNITFDYSSFEPSAVSKPPVAYGKGYQYGIAQPYNGKGKITVNHSDFWGFGNGIELFNSTQEKPFTVSNSWFHDASADGGGIYHTDAILSNDGGPSYMVIDHNTIVSEGNTNGLAFQYDGSGYSNVKVTNNYFSGFGFTVNIGGSGAKNKNVTFTGNTFGTDIKPYWGPLYGWEDGNGNTWRNNKWRVVPGSYWTTASDDGKYWLPDGSAPSTSDYTK